jgi:hypothetical protein
MSEESPGYGEFELDIPTIMKETLPAFFDGLDATPLTLENVSNIPEGAQGAYCLLLDGNIVYVGKTDAQKGFQQRLTRHYYNVQNRKGLNPDAVAFKAVRVFVFSTFDLETMLINEYTRLLGARPVWNASGFGSNDPGRNREEQRAAVFDLRHPVDIDRDINSIVEPGEHEILLVLRQLKDGLPHLFRYEADEAGSWRLGHAEMRGVKVMIPSGPLTTRSVLQACLDVMGPDWQATVLPNRVILYQERRKYAAQVEVLRGRPPP